ncbi:Polyadenylate-binding protein RBP47C [Acorus gramineus]|uniref:Polyadenylate-binding protein RBP47C n=1 Tax=Acorus gramineus TaxID=55184 RepID=A0AAV9BEX4_ACOGR|nr:Polyadenylate-binding protein RBP47C [Acorus gramineus]
MDFDEIDYLEKSLEDPKEGKKRPSSDGGGGGGSGEKSHRSSRNKLYYTHLYVKKRNLEFINHKKLMKFKDKKEVVEPEADPERDQRTVFAFQMPLKATERDVYEFFSKAGKVRDVRLIMDRNSRRSKGVGYIEFYDVMSVPMAIALSGQHLFGQPVMVKPSEAEKNLVQSTSGGGSGGLSGAGMARKLYVGNLHFNITEDQLKQVFEPFGPVELVQLPLDPETGQCKGFGFVQFAQLEHAKAAQSLNGKLEIAGRVIKVSSVTDHVGGQDVATNAADFDDDDGGGLSLNAHSRAILMQKLDRTGTATSYTHVYSIAESLGVPVINGAIPNQQPFGLPMNGPVGFPATAPILAVPPQEPIGTPSECILLKNMFDPSTEMDPEFDLDIRDEVQDECSRFGPVKHIYVDNHFEVSQTITISLLPGITDSSSNSGVHGTEVGVKPSKPFVMKLWKKIKWMDRYQRVEKPREETPINENEIRITTQGRMRNYITYATGLLQEKGSDEIVLKAMGRAINKTVMIAELIKRRIVGLHQNTSIGSNDITDMWEPLEEGLLP